MKGAFWVVILALILTLGALGIAWGALAWFQRPFGAKQDEPVLVSIPSGAGGAEVAGALERAGVIDRAWRFRWLLRITGDGALIKAGEYAFEPPLNPADIARKLTRGEMNLVSVTIAEGLTLEETADAVVAAGLGEKQELLAAFRDPQSIRDLDPAATTLEGYLFPETYRFAKGVSARRIGLELVGTFRAKFAIPERIAIERSGHTLRDLVTIGSLVEKEAAAAPERARVSGVIAERLQRKMLLQVDPTLIYARKLAGTWNGNLTRADLLADGPFNSYTRAGLPPSPIASPGLASLRAALAPEHRSELYYVSRGDGTHQFSRTLVEHNAAVRRFQLHRR